MIRHRLQEAMRQLGLPAVDFVITKASRPEFGDFSANAALLAAKQLKVNPSDLAQKIADQLNRSSSDFSTQTASPGFLNFFCSAQMFSSVVQG